ncbi:hypothetical protein F4810DRAFT_506116 [Camillea tinctor]|nr:hypothetical protein F4810DRAFT_506116 [Camillea tinctor]
MGWESWVASVYHLRRHMCCLLYIIPIVNMLYLIPQTPKTAKAVTLLQCILLLVSFVSAQYIQDYQWRMLDGQLHPFWRRERGLEPEPALIPRNPVVLYYNCYYMRAICKNAQAWLNSPRGQNRQLVSVLNPAQTPNSHLFGYDMNSRVTSQRGNAMCPSSWKNNHPCPERDPNTGVVTQPEIMPDDWYSKERETDNALHLNEIRAKYVADPNSPNGRKLDKRSGRYYTCEEWPPRSFVEGGVGTPGQGVLPEGDGNAGNTICAPMSINSQCAGTNVPRNEQVWSEQSETIKSRS